MSLDNLFLILKHLGGQHDQKSHGRSGSGSGTQGPPKAGIKLGLLTPEGGTGTRLGNRTDAEHFTKGSQIKEDLYWGTPYPESVLREGIRPSTDEVIVNTPGISLGRTLDISQDYTGDNGRVFKVKVHSKNPVTQWSNKVKGYDPHDPEDFDSKAKAQGFDAIISPGEIRVFSADQVMILSKDDGVTPDYAE